MFGYDMLRNAKTGQYAVVDVNYFPGKYFTLHHALLLGVADIALTFAWL